jgi:hypothetical protein
VAILTKSKQEVDQQFGMPVMASNLIGGGDFFKGEKAYEYDVGDFRVVVGFYKDIGRYACFRKQSLADQAFAPEDVESSLMLIAPASQWKSSTDSNPASSGDKKTFTIGSTGTTSQYQTTIKDLGGNDVDVLAWHRTTKPYVFAYCPLLPGQPAIAASPIQIDKNFGQA